MTCPVVGPTELVYFTIHLNILMFFLFYILKKVFSALTIFKTTHTDQQISTFVQYIFSVSVAMIGSAYSIRHYYLYYVDSLYKLKPTLYQQTFDVFFSDTVNTIISIKGFNITKLQEYISLSPKYISMSMINMYNSSTGPSDLCSSLKSEAFISLVIISTLTAYLIMDTYMMLKVNGKNVSLLFLYHHILTLALLGVFSLQFPLFYSFNPLMASEEISTVPMHFALYYYVEYPALSKYVPFIIPRLLFVFLFLALRILIVPYVLLTAYYQKMEMLTIVFLFLFFTLQYYWGVKIIHGIYKFLKG